MLKTVYVPVLTYPDGNEEALIEHVAGIASAIGADVDIEFQEVTFPNFSNVLANAVVDVPGMISAAKVRSSSRRNEIETVVQGYASRSSVKYNSSSLKVYEVLFAGEAAKAARYRDLSIVGLRPDFPAAGKLAEAIIFGSGRPTILVPENLPAEDIKNITIAWDGTKVAARAVADALPFLQLASNIIIATVVDEKPLATDSGAQLKRYLATHGLTATEGKLRLEGRSISETLHNEARKNGNGLLVMGGFGHSRMRDFVLGGATRGILGNLTVPVLVSH